MSIRRRFLLVGMVTMMLGLFAALGFKPAATSATRSAPASSAPFAAVPEARCTTPVYDNGSFVNGFGNGANGADTSLLTSPDTLFGAGANGAASVFVADDFVLTTTIAPSQVTFYSYQTGTFGNPPVSTLTGIHHMSLWNGPPGDGGTLISGPFTPTLGSTGWTGVYRAQSTTPTNAQRPIMDVTVDWPFASTLTPGTYWIEWALTGTLASGPWVGPTNANGNARQSLNGTWAPLTDAGSTDPIGLPFTICGTSGGGTPTPTPTGTLTPTATNTPTITPTETPTNTPSPTPDPSCTLNEGFDDILSLPGADWSQQNLSTPLGTTGWFQGNPLVFPAQAGAETDSYIGANFNNTTGGTGTISNWLLTPVQTLNNGTTLKFWTRIPDGDEFPDRLEIRLSTAGTSTNTADFTTVLLTINPDLTTGVYPKVWTQFTATVSGLSAPTTGRFAFRYFVTAAGPTGENSNYIGIDTVSVCAGGGGGTPTPTNTPGTPTATNTPTATATSTPGTPTVTSTPQPGQSKLHLPLIYKPATGAPLNGARPAR
ncbi:MAG TPA: choice-of-anchor J domain-containing protein [Herpetosiphonaceae bacterium]